MLGLSHVTLPTRASAPRGPLLKEILELFMPRHGLRYACVAASCWGLTFLARPASLRPEGPSLEAGNHSPTGFPSINGTRIKG